MSFTTHVQNDLVWLTSSLLGGSPHGFSTRKGGVSPAPWDSLNLRSGCGDSQDHVLENFHRLCWAVGITADRLVLSKQVHETTVRPCTFSDAGKGLWLKQDYTADALITNEPGLPLTVFSADCGVILLHDPIQGAVGAVHAGWRGCAGGILEKTVEELHRLYGSHPSHLRAALGPCIGQCCFETDDDVPEAMLASLGQDAAACLKRQGPKWHVDLAFQVFAPPATRISSGPTEKWGRSGAYRPPSSLCQQEVPHETSPFASHLHRAFAASSFCLLAGRAAGGELTPPSGGGTL